MEASTAKLPVGTPPFNVSKPNINLISAGALAGCSGAGNSTLGMSSIAQRAAELNSSLMRLERNPHAALDVFSHQAYVGVYDLRSLEGEPEVHLPLGTD